MRSYIGRIDTTIFELEDGLHNCKNNRIYVIEYDKIISRVCEVNKNTGHIYRNLCCKTEGNINNYADRLWIRKKLMGVRGIRSAV